ncbi:MAG: transposase [Pseudomonadota bacterium]
MKFSKDRRRWLQWLYEAKRRYGLTILNYMVTSNHIHLLVVDDGDQDMILRSIQFIAGRTGQEYNQRKTRKGAFWEDRYHATAVEKGEHLFRCIVYIDLNMVRAGVVDHPSQWPFCGYNEIQSPRRKNVLIKYDTLRELVGVETYDQVKEYHQGWLDEYLRDGNNRRDEKWTKSIAVGSKGFVQSVQSLLGALARGRKVRQAAEAYQLREPSALYGDHFGVKDEAIGPKNTCYWNVYDE